MEGTFVGNPSGRSARSMGAGGGHGRGGAGHGESGGKCLAQKEHKIWIHMVFPVVNITYYKGFSMIFHDLVPFKPIVLWQTITFLVFFEFLRRF